ncbi:unnamed protein product (mitochondrion) [Plasmodiophora brassicae]|uniref:Protein arginine N-methyltransferase domain-containing protein n=1 Tax=Plasmodiophora brassicae TaxID=37360 RepID=A0A3P3XZP6_PLABS|nr:unnamed protein product [Plasmodiophora brassicae]
MSPLQAEQQRSKKRLRHRSSSSDMEHEYFGMYSNIDIHEEMLLDASRTEAYRNAILSRKDLFDGATAGAAHVYSVDAADVMDTIEDIEELADGAPKVDIIVSEWMGYALLFESMVESVLLARDRFLRPGGHMFPCSARIFMAPFTNDDFLDKNVRVWHEPMYGQDLSALTSHALQRHIAMPQIVNMSDENIIGGACVIRTIDLGTEPANPETLMHLSADLRMPCIAHASLHGVCAWFDVTFPGGIVLSTSPSAEPTHWAQTAFFFDANGVDVDQDDVLTGKVDVQPAPDSHRLLRFDFAVRLMRNKAPVSDPYAGQCSMGCCHSAAAVQPVNGAVEIDNLAEIPDDAADTNSTVSGSEEDARLTGPPDIEPGDAVTPVEIAPENNDIKDLFERYKVAPVQPASAVVQPSERAWRTTLDDDAGIESDDNDNGSSPIGFLHLSTALVEQQQQQQVSGEDAVSTPS